MPPSPAGKDAWRYTPPDRDTSGLAESIKPLARPAKHNGFTGIPSDWARPAADRDVPRSVVGQASCLSPCGHESRTPIEVRIQAKAQHQPAPRGTRDRQGCPSYLAGRIQRPTPRADSGFPPVRFAPRMIPSATRSQGSVPKPWHNRILSAE